MNVGIGVGVLELIVVLVVLAVILVAIARPLGSLFALFTRKKVMLHCPHCGAETPADLPTCVSCQRELA